MPLKKPFKIRFSFLQMFKIFIAAFLLIMLSFMFLFVGFTQDPEGKISMKLMLISLQIVGGLSLLLFVPLIMYLFFSIITMKPGFIISEEGITDKSQLYSAGFIKWDEIKKLSVGSKHTVAFLSIDLYDSDLILNRAGFFKRFFLRANEFLTSNKVQVDFSRLAINSDELVKQLSLYSNNRFNAETITETNVAEWKI